MTTLEKKDLIQGLVDKKAKSNEREISIKKELTDDTLTFSKIQEMMGNSEPLPIDSPYESYEEWTSSIEKEINTGIKSLTKIDEQKVEIEALEYYINNYAD